MSYLPEHVPAVLEISGLIDGYDIFTIIRLAAFLISDAVLSTHELTMHGYP